MNKYFFLLLLLFTTSLVISLPVWGEGVENKKSEELVPFENTLKNLDLNVFEEYKKNIDEEINSSMKGKTVKGLLLDFTRGKLDFKIQDIMGGILQIFFKEVRANSALMAKLLILSVLTALLVNLQNSFSQGVAQISYMSCYLALGAIALGSFRLVLDIGHQSINNMVAFMMGMLPQMLVLTAGLGNINASAILFPILMTTATAFANAIKNVVFPLIIMSAILNLLNHMSSSLKVDKLASFFGQMAKVSLGFCLTIFAGFITLRALYASVLDKVALRTTKFFTDNAIPVVGKILSDTIEVTAGYVVMLKQALGLVGVLIIIGIIAMPLLKVAAVALIYKVTAAVVEPIGDAKTAAILDIMSAHLFLMLAAVASVGLMFLIMISIVAGMSNGLGALR
ncbi:MAG: stage III sporulation protein AE [Syntrophomonas sp.]|uniref:stage III sporulation protein AE n=1 Tax=Syntrophomonas sp. TaxID=2053627 RepID=UPI002630E6DB|nr:stage III sporulation protein AE [Syntrophomonas sp.]MDD2510242.1 stage III sporulation protein AE [Syntrophomonas sp.]MDD3878800.1 stage III sporulation protein AE [Syntrophomonas sp.]MDD4626826.1 stage III sporulation protein AE [Syntrophomonas sp.]